VTAAPAQAGELTERVAQLEGEIAGLRQVLKRLKGEKSGTDEVAA